MSTGTALYYPYIHPRNINHLKASLLYWDRIRRIVPQSIRKGAYAWNDSEDAKLLADEELLLATSPTPYEGITETKFIDQLGEDTARYVLSPDAAQELSRDGGVLHIEKIAPGVRSKLEERGMAHTFGEWVSMHGEIATFYMHCLATVMSTAIAAPLLADSDSQAQAGTTLLFGAGPSEPTRSHLIQFELDLPSPADMATVPLKRVIKFAKQRADERAAFRIAIEGIVDVAATITDPNQLSDYLATNAAQIRKAAADLRATVDEIHVGAISAAARISVPAAVTSLAALPTISPTVAAAVGVAGIAASVVAWLAERRGKLRQVGKGAPYHYLLSLERSFPTHS